MNRKIALIIDDEEDFSGMLREHLEAITDFEVFTAKDGRQGLKLADTLKPNLIILDIIMPGMDGFEVLKNLKSKKSTLDIPVIMLSAKTDDSTKIKAARLFDEIYVTKPVDVDDLKAKMEEIFRWRGEKIG